MVVVRLFDDGKAWVVACSSSVPEGSHPDKVRMPDSQRFPASTTGFDRPTWAVPAWLLELEQESLAAQTGYCGGKVLAAVSINALKRVVEGGKPPLAYPSPPPEKGV
ncbi:MAG: hypothetical protein K2Q09_11100 [Phycisphaerales bacterium]|nr:hypothetical protein [Phycisphaerales bacterium]